MPKVIPGTPSPLSLYYLEKQPVEVMLDVLFELSRAKKLIYLPGGLSNIKELPKWFEEGMVITINSIHSDVYDSFNCPSYLERVPYSEIHPQLKGFYILQEITLPEIKIHAHLIFNNIPGEGSASYWFDIKSINPEIVSKIHDHLMRALVNPEHE
jgi:hypothetical protein